MKTNDIYNNSSEEHSNLSDLSKNLLTGGVYGLLDKAIREPQRKSEAELKAASQAQSAQLSALRDSLEQQQIELKNQYETNKQSQDVVETKLTELSQGSGLRTGGNTTLFMILGVVGVAVAGFFVYKAVRKKK